MTSGGGARRADRERHASWQRILLGNVALAIGYAAVGTLSLMLVRDTGIASPVWPAAGVAFAVVFLRGAWYLPGAALGSFLTNLPNLLRGGEQWVSDVAVSACIALGVALGAYAGTVLVRRFIGRAPMLVQAREILLFLSLAGLLATAITATIGTAVQWLAGILVGGQVGLAWLTWWAGDSVGVIVFAPIVMMFMPGQEEQWRARRWKVIAPSLIVLAIAVVGVMQNSELILRQRELLLEQDAIDAAAALQGELSSHDEMLESVVAFEQSSQSVTQAEFATFTESFLARHHDIQAISWNPLISDSERSAFIAQQRQQPALESFEITERTAEGELVPAGQRDEYVTVGYIEPMVGNAAALGYDVYSNPVRAEAIDRARSSGTAQVTAPVDLVQERGKQKGVLLFAPSVSDDGEIEGFAVGVYRLGDLLDEAVGQESKWDGWNFRLIDTSAGIVDGRPVVLAERVVDGDTDGPLGATTAMVSRAIDIGGRTWTLEAWPSAVLLAEQPAATPLLLLLGTLVISLLLEAFLLLVTGMERQWRREVTTSNYAAIHDELTGLLNRRGFFQRLEAVRERAITEDSEHVMLFLDLDGFKPVNDSAGHDAGDAVLRAVSAALQGAVRDRDTVARIGGDEFAIIVHNCAGSRGLAIAESVRDAVDAVSVRWNGATCQVSVSIGLTVLQGTATGLPDEIVREADEACYEAKHSGRGRVCCYSGTDLG